MMTLLAPFFFLKALPIHHLQIYIIVGCYGKPFERILSGIMVALILVTPCGAIPFPEAMSVSSHTHALGGDLCGKI